MISVNDSRLWIRQNLWDFLQAARRRTEFQDKLFWIDAICIDQRSYVEWQQQVQQVGDIFAQANLVISWLGISKDIATALTKAKTSGASESPLQSRVVRFYEAFRNSPYWQRASASEVSTVKIWGASSGACLQTLEGHSLCVSSAHLVSILASLHSN
jgi:WD40 repeat protein